MLQVVREADGYQKSLVSPEAGLRRLVSDCVESVLDPVSRTVMRIHMVLLNVARYVLKPGHPQRLVLDCIEAGLISLADSDAHS